MKKPISVVLIFVLITVFGFFAFNNFIYQQKQGNGESVAPYEATLTGVYVCLPHRDTSGPQTLECAYGLKTQVGEYYALDFGENVPLSNFVSGESVTLSGIITPIEYISSDYWQKYAIAGIFSVK
ncbi:hypothetical protein C4579_03030 [Candidatus Microgenomates bacterium]|nr:MAG: hypothetical protein C4579_03030 [Candidatus Microgenomates bacterium]